VAKQAAIPPLEVVAGSTAQRTDLVAEQGVEVAAPSSAYMRRLVSCVEAAAGTTPRYGERCDAGLDLAGHDGRRARCASPPPSPGFRSSGIAAEQWAEGLKSFFHAAVLLCVTAG
jgi:hypothetical protein